MHLLKASSNIPAGLADFLLELGDGEAGFSGTSFGQGEATLEEFVRACCDGEDEANVPPGRVAQTIFWMIDGDRVVGMVRMRHRLNKWLNTHGGHVGYYVRISDRGKGHAKAALRSTVERLGKMGVERVLVTVRPGNEASTRVVLASGGIMDGQGQDPTTGQIVNRYWIAPS